MFIRSLSFLAAIPLLTAATEPPALRLPDFVVPLGYRVELRLTPGEDDFSGRTRIAVQVKTETPVIWIHAKDLQFRSVTIGGVRASAEPAANDFVALLAAKSIGTGRTEIDISYSGKVSRVLTDGVFQQQYANDWYLFTKFEPVTARRAFPCFDEPRFKTPWELTLDVPSGISAYSNTAGTPNDAGAGRQTVRFGRTKPLPTYLVAFAAGPFETVEVAPSGRNRVPGRMIVPKGRSADAKWAALQTPNMVAMLEDYFGIPFPFDKVDQIVVPFTTAWGAAEHAGLIAYGDFVLARPSESGSMAERGRASVMVHELGHQWFGNLVTMEWWDDIWLNEGFASFVSQEILNRWHPEWNVRSSAVTAVNAAMNADSLTSARIVRQPIRAPGEIANAFDSISYQKGAGILSMFSHWLGTDVFRAGITAYLKAHSWGSATSADFAAAVSKAAGRDLSRAFSSFLNQGGVPLLDVKLDCSGARPVLSVRQERLLPIGTVAPAPHLWTLPVCFRWRDGSREYRQCDVVGGKAAELTIRNATSCPARVVVNEGGTGYYRVAYDAPLFANLVEAEAGVLTPAETASLVNDVRALTASGKMAADQAMKLAMRYGASSDLWVIQGVQSIVAALRQVTPSDLRPAFIRWVDSWLGERARQLGFRPREQESPEARVARLMVVSMAVSEGNQPSLAREAKELAESWFSNWKSLDDDSLSYVLPAAGHLADREWTNKLIEELRKRGSQRDRVRIAAALSVQADPELLGEALKLALNPGLGLEPKDLDVVVRAPRPSDVRWRFVRDNFDALNTKLPGARGIPYGATLPFIASGFCDEEHLKEVESFFGPRLSTVSGLERNLAIAVESIRSCIARRKALEPSLREFLKGYSVPGGRGDRLH